MRWTIWDADGRRTFIHYTAWLALLLAACQAQDPYRMNAMLEAVSDRDEATVRRFAALRNGLEERNEIGATPLIVATTSNQFVIAEVLVDAGADVFAADKFGVTAGLAAETSRLRAGSIEGDARERVLAKLKARGFPFPAPAFKQVKAMVAAGQWPPPQPARN